MGMSVTWHVVSVPTSPGTSRHPPRPIRLAPVFRFCLWPQCPLSTISPFSALFTRCPDSCWDWRWWFGIIQPWTELADNTPEISPLAHPHTYSASEADNGRRWFPRRARSDCALVNIGMLHRGTRNWMLLSIATWSRSMPFHPDSMILQWEKCLNDRDIIETFILKIFFTF